MSADIVERLRGAGRLVSKEEAAAEIERLRAALDALVMACELPGDHCEVEQALPAARAALASARDGERGA